MCDFSLCKCAHCLQLGCMAYVHNMQDSTTLNRMHVSLHTACSCLMDQSSLSDMILHDVITCSLICPLILPLLTRFTHFASFEHESSPLAISLSLSLFTYAHSSYTMFCCLILSFPLRWAFKAFPRFWLYELMFSWLLLLNTYNLMAQCEKCGMWTKTLMTTMVAVVMAKKQRRRNEK